MIHDIKQLARHIPHPHLNHQFPPHKSHSATAHQAILDGERIQTMKRLTLVMGLLVVLMATAFGQGNFLHAKIPFEFVAGGKTLPAGNYDFNVSNKLVQMKNLDTGKTVGLGFLTRVASDTAANGTARISFDVQQDKHFIEAIWPEQGDGYLVHTAKGEHTHEIVRLK